MDYKQDFNYLSSGFISDRYMKIYILLKSDANFLRMKNLL